MRAPSRRKLHTPPKQRRWNFGAILAIIALTIMLAYAFTLSTLIQQQNFQQQEILAQQQVTNKRRIEDGTMQLRQVAGDPAQRKASTAAANNNSRGAMTYKEWRDLALRLARLPAAQVLAELETKDPFGTRTFEKQLLESESTKGAVLDLSELRRLFPCPKDRITLPDQRNHTQALAFRSNVAGSFLFFQHLRKAGGTNFCTLAKDNLPKQAVAAYYCMSDYRWSRERNQTMAGYLHHWTNEEIAQKMAAAGHRVTGNEWDNFDRLQHFKLPAVFATSFRRPLDRALSQYRFECVEDRGCHIKDVGEWWKHRRDLYNVYTVTFADASRAGIVPIYENDGKEHQDQRAQLMANALDTVAKFHLVLSMEWLAYAKPQVEGILGFADTSSLTKRVRPHITQHHRDDGQEVNNLGAAGIAKASWTPKEYLTPAQYEDFSERLALDEILTDAARRMFLERMACDDLEA